MNDTPTPPEPNGVRYDETPPTPQAWAAFTDHFVQRQLHRVLLKKREQLGDYKKNEAGQRIPTSLTDDEKEYCRQKAVKAAALLHELAFEETPLDAFLQKHVNGWRDPSPDINDYVARYNGEVEKLNEVKNTYDRQLQALAPKDGLSLPEKKEHKRLRVQLKKQSHEQARELQTGLAAQHGEFQKNIARYKNVSLEQLLALLSDIGNQVATDAVPEDDEARGMHRAIIHGLMEKFMAMKQRFLPPSAYDYSTDVHKQTLRGMINESQRNLIEEIITTPGFEPVLNLLWKLHEPIIESLVREQRDFFKRRGVIVEHDEMKNEHYRALVGALRTYEPDKGIFSTHLQYWLRHKPLESIQLERWGTIAAANPFKMKFIKDIKSLNTPVGGSASRQALTLLDEVAAKTPANPSKDIADYEHDSAVVNSLLETLPRREADILSMRFGLREHDPHSLEETGKLMKVSKERIRQIQNKVLERAKNNMDGPDHLFKAPTTFVARVKEPQTPLSDEINRLRTELRDLLGIASGGGVRTVAQKAKLPPVIVSSLTDPNNSYTALKKYRRLSLPIEQKLADYTEHYFPGQPERLDALHDTFTQLRVACDYRANDISRKLG